MDYTEAQACQQPLRWVLRLALPRGLGLSRSPAL